jgi:hypothetical protein
LPVSARPLGALGGETDLTPELPVK